MQPQKKKSLKRDAVICACAYKSKGGDYVKPEWLDEHNDGKEYTPSYNIAPTDVTPIIVSSSAFKNDKGARIIKPMMWGMIPPWQKETYKNHNLTTNNCRLENINTSKLYYPALRDGRRCVVIMEGFYEWQTTNKTSKIKQPYYIYAKQSDGVETDDPKTWTNTYSEDTGWNGIRLLHVAGLYNVWQYDDITMYSYSVITMNSNKTFDWLHHRMPAVLETDGQIDAWLDIDNVKSDKALTYLKATESLEWHPVSTNVNNSRYKSDDCNKRVVLENKLPQKTITSFFTKANKRTLGSTDSVDRKKMKN